MAETSKSLIDLKKESEELNNSIHTLLDEAVSYKNATGSLLHVTETLHAASTNMLELSNKTATVINTLEGINPNEIHEIRSDVQNLIACNKSVMDRLETIEANQKSYCAIISETLEKQKEETAESIETNGKKIVVFGVISFILLIVILIKVIVL